MIFLSKIFLDELKDRPDLAEKMKGTDGQELAGRPASANSNVRFDMIKRGFIKHSCLLVALAAIGASVQVPSFALAGIDLEVETEATFADSEGALAEAEEARRRAADEKQRARAEKDLALKEAKRAKELETSAKKKIARYQDEEKANRTEREAAEKKTRIAREEMRKIESELQAKEAELAALKDLTDKSVAERDQTERDL